jgi:hypothetical protein
VRNEPDGPHRHRTSPEVTVGVARARVVSWLRDRRTRLPDRSSVAFESGRNSRYSGGAAPAFHRFPWPPHVTSIVNENLGGRAAIFNCFRRHQSIEQVGATLPVVVTGRSLPPRRLGVDMIERSDFARQ